MILVFYWKDLTLLVKNSPPPPGKVQISHPLDTDDSQMLVGCTGGWEEASLLDIVLIF